MRLRYVALSFLASILFWMPTAYANVGGLIGTSETIVAGKVPSTTSTKITPGNSGTTIVHGDNRNASFSCGAMRFTNGKSLTTADGGRTMSITNVSEFINLYGQSLYNKIKSAPTYTSGGHAIHLYHGPCGIEFNLDQTLAPKALYKYEVTLTQPWNYKKGNVPLGSGYDYSGTNLNEQYCIVGEQPVNGSSVKHSGYTWTYTTTSNTWTPNWGCAGMYQIKIFANGKPDGSTQMHPVYPWSLPQASVPQTTSKSSQGNLWLSK